MIYQILSSRFGRDSELTQKDLVFGGFDKRVHKEIYASQVHAMSTLKNLRTWTYDEAIPLLFLGIITNFTKLTSMVDICNDEVIEMPPSLRAIFKQANDPFENTLGHLLVFGINRNGEFEARTCDKLGHVQYALDNMDKASFKPLAIIGTIVSADKTMINLSPSYTRNIYNFTAFVKPPSVIKTQLASNENFNAPNENPPVDLTAAPSIFPTKKRKIVSNESEKKVLKTISGDENEKKQTTLQSGQKGQIQVISGEMDESITRL